MTSHHTKFQLDSSKRSRVIPLWKWPRRQRRRRHPPGLNYSPRRNVFRRGQKNFSVPYTVLTCPTPQMTILLLYIKEIRWQVMLFAWGLIIIHKLNNHPSRKTEGPLRWNKTVFIFNKHRFQDVNEKIEVNSMFKKRRYGMPAVRLNMEITKSTTILISACI